MKVSLANHCEVAGLQVPPPSAVSKTFVLPRFQMVAWSASVARTPPKSSSSGEWSTAQCEPASVVRRMVPARPTIQQTFSEGAEPAVRSTTTLLLCRDQEAPPSLENSIMPAWPARQSVFLLGVTIKFKSAARATRSEETLPSLNALGERGAAAACRAAPRDSAFAFFCGAASAGGFGAGALNGLCCACTWPLAVSVCPCTICAAAAATPTRGSGAGWFAVGLAAMRSCAASSRAPRSLLVEGLTGALLARAGDLSAASRTRPSAFPREKALRLLPLDPYQPTDRFESDPIAETLPPAEGTVARVRISQTALALPF